MAKFSVERKDEWKWTSMVMQPKYAIKQKIEYFYGNPDEIKRMGRNARQKAENYSWETVEEGYRKLITDTLSS